MNTHIDLSRYWYIFRGGIAAPFFAWFGLFLLVMVFYTLNASAQMLGDIVWQDAAFFATGWWTSVFGGSVTIGETPVTLMPTLLTTLVVYASYQTWRSREISTWLEALAGALSWPAVVIVLGLVGRAPGDWWFAIIGSVLLAGLTAVWSGREKLLFTVPLWRYLAAAAPYIRWFGIGMIVLAGTTTIAMLLTHFSTIADVHSYYRTGVMGSIGLVILQLLYLPSLAVWFYSWLIGSGFAIGAGTNFSTLGVDAGPLPAIPVFGALPQPGTSMIWLFVAVIVVSLLFGVVLGRYVFRTEIALRDHMIRSASALAVCALGVSIISFIASGALGPGRMATTGPVPALTAGFTIVVIGIPVITGLFLIHPVVVRRMRVALGRDLVPSAENKEASTHPADQLNDVLPSHETSRASADGTPGAPDPTPGAPDPTPGAPDSASDMPDPAPTQLSTKEAHND
ncbi:cell division protein PerM [Arcanobacterium pinnipediorum]|uniref:DUF6350 family protein n=1 Tax=Arcanobacterium pinnipediorum TaxID=1503041 RepID=A0ABY5AG24_9ACTO|nr:DUF6350 family protein [Arcanobacterium pinnipediorum]USR78997.1 DUF6350 family protein [Arcanobacterium pinnipediorum]